MQDMTPRRSSRPRLLLRDDCSYTSALAAITVQYACALAVHAHLGSAALVMFDYEQEGGWAAKAADHRQTGALAVWPWLLTGASFTGLGARAPAIPVCVWLAAGAVCCVALLHCICLLHACVCVVWCAIAAAAHARDIHLYS
ncbi:hypothetical protein COO60DRAFT_1150659 [Scenedesmus sp. NREL 46B-D3]|nr:hypothetical protein COO60DRAFT_1150659 [Scenedesmus sp. NREL 46B-D3]